ncbi:aldehyde dehydrogenase (NADP(+)) [Pseudonocardia hispaniensis]|uniref:Aldehyde dehydrogenase (NADP(+)) n=1 Tax=Pseudonocardia hispaniensis TaxID=904933 RepID=A0ABW1J7U9_9PSEU
MNLVTSVDPRTGNNVETVAAHTSDDEVAAQCRAAARATGVLGATEPARRAQLLRAIATELENNRDGLVPLADRESALGPVRLHGELTRTTNQLRLFADVVTEGSCFEATIDHADPAATPPAPDLRRVLVAIGPVGVFGASNFPFAFSVAGGDTASALAAGCAVVVKAHGAHPALSAAVARIMREVCVAHGLPAETVGLAFGRAAGQALVQDPHIKAVGFTGSESGGRQLFDLACARSDPIPFYAEMGSLNPLIVSAGAALERTEQLAAGIAGSVTLGHGQFCTKPGVILIPAGAAGDALLDRLGAQITAVAPQYLLSSGIRDAFHEGVERLLRTTRVEEAARGSRPDGAGTLAEAVLAQTDAATVLHDRSVLTECFGPAALAVRYRDEDELIQVLEAVPPSLTVSLHAGAEEIGLITRVRDVATRRTGRVVFGGYPTGVAVGWAQHHGGPYPATSCSLFTSVGASSIRRFLRPVAYQSWPDALLPPALQEANPLGIPRRVDGVLEPAHPVRD